MTDTRVLLTGGAGFIGSHAYVALKAAGFHPVVVDNFSNSDRGVLARLAEITGESVDFHEADILDKKTLVEIVRDSRVSAVMHFAGLKAVGESVEAPLLYYRNNIVGTITLLEVMREAGIRKFVFSSSATVYGESNKSPISEQEPLSATNPYGDSKLFSEKIIERECSASKRSANVLHAISLRYFNPVGAHPSGLIGESPNGIPSNLCPFILKVATGELDELKIFGKDYDTHDGTGVRDYVHVVDLAEGHVSALNWLLSLHVDSNESYEVVNLGTGNGYSVLDLVRAFETGTGERIKSKFAPRRAGDVGSCYADVTKAEQLLKWSSKRLLPDIVADSWRWQVNNPNGYS